MWKSVFILGATGIIIVHVRSIACNVDDDDFCLSFRLQTWRFHYAAHRFNYREEMLEKWQGLSISRFLVSPYVPKWHYLMKLCFSPVSAFFLCHTHSFAFWPYTHAFPHLMQPQRKSLDTFMWEENVHIRKVSYGSAFCCTQLFFLFVFAFTIKVTGVIVTK